MVTSFNNTCPSCGQIVQPQESMVNRIADSLFTERGSPVERDTKWGVLAQRVARDVLAQMREPTDGMLAMFSPSGARKDAAEFWRKMIDAALEGK